MTQIYCYKNLRNFYSQNYSSLLANQEGCFDIQFGPRVRFSSSFVADVENVGLVVYWVKHKQRTHHICQFCRPHLTGLGVRN